MEEKIKQLEEQIADLKSRWPAHSVPPAMVQQLDDLEEELEQLRNHRQGDGDRDVASKA